MVSALKRCICLILVMSAVLILCSCDIKSTQERFTSADVSMIAFVYAERDGIYEIKETLDPDLQQEFLDDYFQLAVYEYWNDPVDAVEGDAILLQLTDGSFYLIARDCTEYFTNDKSKDTRQYYDKDEFILFWNTYCSYAYGASTP